MLKEIEVGLAGDSADKMWYNSSIGIHVTGWVEWLLCGISVLEIGDRVVSMTC